MGGTHTQTHERDGAHARERSCEIGGNGNGVEQVCTCAWGVKEGKGGAVGLDGRVDGELRVSWLLKSWGVENNGVRTDNYAFRVWCATSDRWLSVQRDAGCTVRAKGGKVCLWEVQGPA